MPKLLFIGDIVGSPGRKALKELLPELSKQHQADFIIVNGENAAGGQGITKAIANEIFSYGADAITLGDHVWDQRGFDKDIDSIDKLCRPANLPESCPGKPYLILEKADTRLGILTLMGRNFMKITADCPFTAADQYLETLKNECDSFFIEIHAETTSEKTALGWYLDGRATLVAGTHTHIPTADATILPRGTAYITDVGMTGPYASCLGRKVQPIIARFIDGMPRRFEIAEDDIRLCGVSVEFDKTGIATHIEQVMQSL